MNARRWTPEEDARLAEMYPTTRTEHVAEALGRSRMAVYLRAQQLNVRKADGCHGNARNPQPWPEDRNASA